MSENITATKAAIIAAAQQIRSWCANRPEDCAGCPFSVKIEGMKHPDCILCDCFPGHWDLSEVYRNE